MTQDAPGIAEPENVLGITTERACTAERFLELLSPRNARWENGSAAWIHRGQGDARWQLLPSALRRPTVFQEVGIPTPHRESQQAWVRRIDALNAMLVAFRERLDRSGLTVPAMGPAILPADTGRYSDNSIPRHDAWPLMAFAQHHGLPTLMLDWSRRPWTAAYFAAVDAAANLANESRGPDLAVWSLRRAAADLRNEERGSPLVILFEPPASTNPNLHAQAGVLTITPGEDDRGLDLALRKTPTLQRLCLPRTESKNLLRLLALEGIDGASLFPGADGVVRAMRESVLRGESRSVSPTHGVRRLGPVVRHSPRSLTELPAEPRFDRL